MDLNLVLGNINSHSLGKTMIYSVLKSDYYSKPLVYDLEYNKDISKSLKTSYDPVYFIDETRFIRFSDVMFQNDTHRKNTLTYAQINMELNKNSNLLALGVWLTNIANIKVGIKLNCT